MFSSETVDAIFSYFATMLILSLTIAFISTTYNITTISNTNLNHSLLRLLPCSNSWREDIQDYRGNGVGASAREEETIEEEEKRCAGGLKPPLLPFLLFYIVYHAHSYTIHNIQSESEDESSSETSLSQDLSTGDT